MTEDEGDFSGRNSCFYINRMEIDALAGDADAVFLFVLITATHAHARSKRFALDFEGMRDAGLTKLSVPRLRAARRALESAGLLFLVSNHKAGSCHQKFSLSRLGAAPKGRAKFMIRDTKEQAAVEAASGYRSDIIEIEDVLE